MKIINEATELVALDKLKPHPKNPRQGDVGAIHVSIEANGFYGSVIAQKSTGHIIAGNHRYLAAKHANAEAIPVTWVDVSDEEAVRILLADNRTNDLATYNDDALAELLQDLMKQTGSLDGTGFDGDALDELLADLSMQDKDEISDNYSRKIEAPIYEITGERPSIAEMMDRSKTETMQAEIHAANLPEEVRAFLHYAAERHTVFNFRNIAEFYAHADEQTQDLMERSALVIIDFNRAIEEGFVKLSQSVAEQYAEDYPDA